MAPKGSTGGLFSLPEPGVPSVSNVPFPLKLEGEQERGPIIALRTQPIKSIILVGAINDRAQGRRDTQRRPTKTPRVSDQDS